MSEGAITNHVYTQKGFSLPSATPNVWDALPETPKAVE